ncbi:SUN domain-containing protein 1-like isoform X2 [Anguilla rostrata]
MSRRSLHLPATGGHHGDDSLQLDSSLNHSASYSVGGASRREARTVRSRKQQFASSTQTQTQTRSQTRTQSSSECSTVLVSQRSRGSCAAGHALQDDSCAHGRAVVDGSWGLAGDGGLKEWRTERSMVLGNGDTSVTQTQTQTQTSMANGYICRDCTILAERKEVLTAYSSTSAAAASSSASSSSSLSQSASSSTSIYSRDNIQKHKSGALVRLSRTCLRYGGHALSRAASLVSLLVQSVLLRTGDEVTGRQGKGIRHGPAPFPFSLPSG